MTPLRAVPTRIRSARLVLRRQHPDDAHLIKDAVDSSVAHLKASVGWAQTAPWPLPIQQERLAASAAMFDAGLAWAFSIFDAEETRVLGGVAIEPAEAALTAIVGAGAFEGGYWLRADATGQGYASEAMASLAEVAFAKLGARRVVVSHDPTNVASGGVPRRLGFECIGTVTNRQLPGRQAADGSVRSETKVWVLDAARGKV